MPTLCDLLLYFVSFVCAFAVYYVSKSAAIAWSGGWVHLRLCTHHLHPVFLPGLCVFRLLLSLYNFAFLQFDLHEQNENTVKDVMPFPDQENIWHDVAQCLYRSKLDMSEVYEQIRIKTTGIPKTAFTTILGTFVSQVMQQGDCNAPSTFQRLMTAIFRDYIGKFVHVYLDDIYTKRTRTPFRIGVQKIGSGSIISEPRQGWSLLNEYGLSWSSNRWPWGTRW